MNILIEQERALHQFDVRQNRTEIKRLIHPSFREIGQSGKEYDVVAILNMMQSEVSTNSRIHSQHYDCVELVPSVQLLTYQSAVVYEKGHVSDYAKRCSIWTLINDLWQLQYHQGTPCQPFELEDV